MSDLVVHSNGQTGRSTFSHTCAGDYGFAAFRRTADAPVEPDGEVPTS
jgi:hypothetical protein